MKKIIIGVVAKYMDGDENMNNIFKNFINECKNK